MFASIVHCRTAVLCMLMQKRRSLMAKDLSVPQAKIYSFIGQYMRQNGRPPTNREIGEAVDIHSTGHVDYHLNMLEKKGYIIRERRKSRGIKLPDQDQRGPRV